jgi:putative oxidoreductase
MILAHFRLFILGNKGEPTAMKLALTKQTVLPARKKVLIFKGREYSETSVTKDVGLLILRLVIGGMLAGHGSQKLFGWFSGPGLKGTAGMVESMGFKPGPTWAAAASASELGGGMLTATGLLDPLGPIGMVGSMFVAITKVHWGKPIWVTKGGAELPVINMAAALALTLTGPGRFSLDRLFGIRLPRPLVISVALFEAAMLVLGTLKSSQEAEEKRQITTTSDTESQASVESSTSTRS